MVLADKGLSYPNFSGARPPTTPLPNWFTLACIFVGVFLYASIFSNTPDPFDPYTRWHCALRFLEEDSINFKIKAGAAHHCMRWAAILPTALGILSFGENLTTFYTVPMLFFALSATMLFFMMTKSLGAPIAGATLLVILTNPHIMNQVSEQQVRPFGWFYLLTALYFISLLRLRYLIIAALFLFLAYGTKVTYLLYFSPGIFAFIFFKMGAKYTAVFGLLLAALFCAETYYFNESLGYVSYGRAEVLAAGENHFALYDNLYPNPLTIKEWIVKPWSDIPLYYAALTAIALLYSLIRLSRKSLRTKTDPLSLCIMAAAISFFVMDKFVLRSIDPIIPVQPLKFDYITTGLILVFYIWGHILYKLSEVVLPMKHAVLFVALALFSLNLAQSINERGDIDAGVDKTRFFAYAGFWLQERNFEVTASLLDQGYALYFNKYPGRKHHNRRIRNSIEYWIKHADYTADNKVEYRRGNLENGDVILSKKGVGIKEARGCIVGELEGVLTVGEAGYKIAPCAILAGYPTPEQIEEYIPMTGNDI